VRLGITDNLRPKPVFDNYLRWIKRIDPNVEFVKLSYHFKNEEMTGNVDGLVLTGGGDVHPALYGVSEAIDRVEEVNELRDAFEFKVIEKALEREIPILGICRGMQVMNVYLGGTLIIDLPIAGYDDHATHDGQEFCHPLAIDPHSMLGSIIGPNPHKVNSIHHQAVDQLGKGLKVVAKSDDGITEALEWVLKDRMPFLLLVQWHPERMVDFDNPCSRNVAEYFMKEVSRSISNHQYQSRIEKETDQYNG